MTEMNVSASAKSERNIIDVENALQKIPNALTIEIDSEHCTFVYPLTPEIAATTAAILRNAGCHIAKNENGWTAIQPAADRWVKDPRAHLRWKAAISRNEPDFNGADVFWIYSDRVNHEYHIDDMQGVDGWSVHINKETKDITVVQTIDQGSGNAAYSAAS